jgi:hypothetical protein
LKYIKAICSEVLAQLTENAEIVRLDIHDRGSIPNYSTLCV